jgi:hypothetical protein
MAQQGKQMRVGARKGFANHSVKLVLLATGNRYEVVYNTFFKGKARAELFCSFPYNTI